jgi:MFS family permease
LGITVIVCAATSTLSLATFALATPMTWLVPASGVVVGGMNSAFITLGMYAAACSEKTALVRNMRLVSLAFTASSIVGPLVASAAMKEFGNDVLMWPLAIASGALAVFTLGVCEGKRERRRAFPAN